jgi:FkbM family methyltransferase
MIKQILKRILPASVVDYIKNARGISFPSFSQEGEDMILRNIFAKKIQKGELGFYVDIGAHHPQIFSNTNFFYRLGWRGINVDAMPGSMKNFRRFRSRDINVEEAVASQTSSLVFFSFNEPALNTFSESLAEERLRIGKFKLLAKTTIDTKTLESILTARLPKGQIIDFLSVDVEGFDLDVLKSNNWETYRPTVLLVESYAHKLDRVVDDPIYIFLTGKGYDLFSKTVNTLIFVERKYEFELY